MTASFMYNAPCVPFEMSRVALIVVANSINEGRIRDIMSRRGWDVEICHDGDKAVDEYVRIEPDLVFLSLDLFFAYILFPSEPVFDLETSREFFRSIIATIIWVPYMLYSKRVKNTFVY